MFKLNPDPTFWAKVGIPVPGGDEVSVDFEFKALSRKALQQFLTDSKGREDIDNLSEVVVGWKGVDKPFSRETLELLLENYVASAKVIWQRFLDELTAARLGN